MSKRSVRKTRHLPPEAVAKRTKNTRTTFTEACARGQEKKSKTS